MSNEGSVPILGSMARGEINVEAVLHSYYQRAYYEAETSYMQDRNQGCGMGFVQWTPSRYEGESRAAAEAVRSALRSLPPVSLEEQVRLLIANSPTNSAFGHLHEE